VTTGPNEPTPRATSHGATLQGARVAETALRLRAVGLQELKLNRFLDPLRKSKLPGESSGLQFPNDWSRYCNSTPPPILAMARPP